jgi:MFS family permease
MNTVTSIHRYLDEAFAEVPVTPDSLDLKEELRSNLSARVAELVSGGADDATAATTAVRELGDIRDLLDGLAADGHSAGVPHPSQRVRPRPVFVLLTVLFSLVLAKSVTWVVLGAFGIVPLWTAVAFAVAAALSVGVIVTLALRQETSQHYPMPTGRALAFGAASLGITLGLGLAAALLPTQWVGAIVAGVPLTVLAILAFVWLGVTQTNRTKPWALELQRQYVAEDPFTQNPAVAARFGIYTVAIWILGIAAFIVLSLTVGWAWSWLALVATFAVFMITLGRMMFVAQKKEK